MFDAAIKFNGHIGASALSGAPLPPVTSATGGIVLFNSTATAYLRTLCTTKTPPAQPCVQQVAFPARLMNKQPSAIVRTAWAWIPDGSTPVVNLYNWKKASAAQGGILTLPALFPAVKLQLSSETPCPETPLDDAKVIPISCFFSIRIPSNNPKVYQLEDLNFNGGRGILVLLGFHVVLREKSGWTFTTFYWQADVENAAYSCAGSSVGCPPGDGRWSHYAMKAVEMPVSIDHNFQAVANPYFEGGDVNNRASNCVVCHDFAANPVNPPGNLISQSFGAAGPVTPRTHDATLNSFIMQLPRVKTDSIWSVVQSRPLQ